MHRNGLFNHCALKNGGSHVECIERMFARRSWNWAAAGHRNQITYSTARALCPLFDQLKLSPTVPTAHENRIAEYRRWDACTTLTANTTYSTHTNHRNAITLSHAFTLELLLESFLVGTRTTGEMMWRGQTGRAPRLCNSSTKFGYDFWFCVICGIRLRSQLVARIFFLCSLVCPNVLTHFQRCSPIVLTYTNILLAKCLYYLITYTPGLHSAIEQRCGVIFAVVLWPLVDCNKSHMRENT